MRTGLYGGCIAVGLLALFGCESFNGSGRSIRAVVGGGAVAGRDYVRGLTPSTAAREWFIQNDLDSSTSVMVRRGDDENATGVRFVANGGIEIPPGAAITYENKGYCLDPHLPAPREGHEFQLVPVSCLIPEGLQGIYDKLVTRAANGDSAVMANMQHLMWALRTAGTDAAYANNLTSEQRRILDSCSEYAGEFEDFCSNERARAQLLGWLIAKVDARLNINIGGVSYKASDLLDPDVGTKKIDAHLQQLIDLGEMVPIEHTGFNYGELENGIYTDVMGTGPLKFRATVANATSQPFVFYPQHYVGQAGSDVSLSSSAITFSATANDAKVQRVTSGPVDEIDVHKREGIYESQKRDEVHFIHIGESLVITYVKQDILLPNGHTFNFSGGEVDVDIVSTESFWGRFSNGFKNIPNNAGAFCTPDELLPFLRNNIYIRKDSSKEEVRHEGIHILTRKHNDLLKYKGTKNEEYLAYMISENGKRTPEDVKDHIDFDHAYDSKDWIPW